MKKIICVVVSVLIIVLLIVDIQHKPKVVEIEKPIEIEVIKDNPDQVELIEKQKKELEQLKKDNEELLKKNATFENTIKSLCTIGKLPQNYNLPEMSNRGGFERYRDNMTYVGVYNLTLYAPTAAECDNNKGITASGKSVIPGYTVAADKNHFKFGTLLYLEKFGIVQVDDRGGAIKGNRLDLCVLSTRLSNEFGCIPVKVYLIK